MSLLLFSYYETELRKFAVCIGRVGNNKKNINNFNCSALCPPPKGVSNNETACVHFVCGTDTCKSELCVYFKYQCFTWAISPEKNSFYAKIDQLP